MNAASARKAWAIMALKTSSTELDETVMDMAELGARLAARRKAAKISHLPRNAAVDRTPSKQALLDQIAKTGANW
ncbi:hypothetical protein [Novosphingobium clariflavum]|uniref:Uncharacterized protein n=2 Tax=Novosphingobium TaxID=165696 RepID=A0ABV6SC26_9SPHN|nr:hypothetical protein [Novosphingobium clariflavum]